MNPVFKILVRTLRSKIFRRRNCLKERFGPGLFDEMEWSKSKGDLFD